MTKNEILKVLNELDMRPSKKLGQNFLIDQNIIDLIIRTVEPKAGEAVLEIGPGTGVLTQKLLENGVNLTAVEFDHRLAKYNREAHACDNFRLIESDACKVNYDELMGSESYRCIANLPYAISSIFIGMLLETESPPKQIFVMLQKEMADRLAANPRTKDYGSLSVRIQALYKVGIARNISRHVFHPPPDVGSALLDAVMRPEAENFDAKFRKTLGEVSKLAFSQRRKQVRKQLGSRYGKEFILDFLAKREISETARAEELLVEDYIALTNAVLSRQK